MPAGRSRSLHRTVPPQCTAAVVLSMHGRLNHQPHTASSTTHARLSSSCLPVPPHRLPRCPKPVAACARLIDPLLHSPPHACSHHGLPVWRLPVGWLPGLPVAPRAVSARGSLGASSGVLKHPAVCCAAAALPQGEACSLSHQVAQTASTGLSTNALWLPCLVAAASWRA